MVEPDAPLTLVLILVTGFVSYLGFMRAGVNEKYVFDCQRILRRREYYRVVSAAFLHANLVHLLMNMYTVYAFGSILERLYGPATMLAIYFASVIGGGLLALAFHHHEAYRALGASGGAVGLVFAAILLLPGGRIGMFFPPVSLPAWLFALLYVAASAYGIRARAGNIGHDAHLGGALVGLVTTALIHPESVSRNPLLFSAILVLAGGLLVFLLRGPYLRPGWILRPGSRPRGQRRSWIREQREPGFPTQLKDRQRTQADSRTTARTRPRAPTQTRAPQRPGERRSRRATIHRLEPKVQRDRLDELLDRISEVGIAGLSAQEKEELAALSRQKFGDKKTP
jgi:membrane associated rhomboid family serine protease